jgi:hypothetical protein
LTERGLEVIAGFEVLAAILIRFAEHALAVFDQIEHDLSEIRARTNAPLPESEKGHGPEGVEGVAPNSFEELLSGDVAIGDFAFGAG